MIESGKEKERRCNVVAVAVARTMHHGDRGGVAIRLDPILLVCQRGGGSLGIFVLMNFDS